MGNEMHIAQATIADLDDLAPLFDAYRQFYAQQADLALARAFVSQRLENGDSVFFLARDAGRAIGFTQLYPSFTSTGCARIYILNDLYVEPAHRGRHVGVCLLNAACDYGRQTGAMRLTLSTAIDNDHAQGVYEGAGWERSDDFITYNFPI